ncbi:MAG: IS21-like element helper ATPase IstB [Dehalococcoidia bacterium]|jgi:DNA replication protein DnaC|nr:IS21-like element helper ATPase IstB [Dehalococcoidia bacterium]|tara:strand:- start:63 stop:875 length:813 start_codon:yes stop_codon:yes gene_type:complete
MLNEQTIATLNAMKLFGMARGFEQRLNSPQHAELSHDEFVGLLVQDEKTYRDNQRLKRLLKNARLRQQAALEDIDYRHPRGLSKQMLLELSSTRWIDAHRNVLVTGPTGIGKSYLACALGNFAARAGYSVLYLRAPRLFEVLQQARGDGSHLKTLTRLAKAQLLIIDDFLLTPPADRERRDLLEIVEDRYQSGSTVITSQCPIRDWHPNIGDPTLADAICDRLFHNAYKIELKGDSMRKDQGESMATSLVANQTDGKGGNLADDMKPELN